MQQPLYVPCCHWHLCVGYFFRWPTPRPTHRSRRSLYLGLVMLLLGNTASGLTIFLPTWTLTALAWPPCLAVICQLVCLTPDPSPPLWPLPSSAACGLPATPPLFRQLKFTAARWVATEAEAAQAPAPAPRATPPPAPHGHRVKARLTLLISTTSNAKQRTINLEDRIPPRRQPIRCRHWLRDRGPQTTQWSLPSGMCLPPLPPPL